MKTELVTVEAGEGVELDGAFYRADEKTGDGWAVSLIHGRSMNFYQGLPRFLPPALVALGYDCLSLNRRGHSVLTLTHGWKPEGDALVSYEDHWSDVDAGMRFLKERGYRNLIVGGHSLGGLLAARLAAEDAMVKGVILASAIPAYDVIPPMFSQEVKKAIIDQAKTAHVGGRGDELLVLSGWPWVMPADKALQELRPVPAILKVFMERISAPVLSFYGSDGTEAMIATAGREALDASPSKNKRFLIIDGTDHFYKGYEGKIQKEVVDWVKSQFTQ